MEPGFGGVPYLGAGGRQVQWLLGKGLQGSGPPSPNSCLKT